MNLSLIFALFFVVFSQLDASRILAVWPILSRSHFNVGIPLFEKLAENGHLITLVSPYEQKNSHANINFVKLEKLANSVNLISFFQMRNMSSFETVKYIIESARDQVDFTLSDENFMKVVKGEEKFDLFMLDIFLNDALLGVAHYLNLPVIAFSSAGSSRWSDEMVKNPLNPAYNPNILSSFTDNMSIFQRLANSVMTIFDHLAYHFYYIPSQESLYKEYFTGMIAQPMPKLIDLVHNVNLVLLNSHPITQFPRAHVPNSVEVGGAHIRSMEDQIHPEFLKVMDKAVDGIIYFSLGGNLKSSELPNEKLEIFLKVFAQMENVLILWKFESVALKERHGNNIIIGPWMPQQEILKHKNLKVFITHCGLLSTMEALYYGKPIIGIPFFSDQKFNMARASAQGYGLQIDYDSLSENSLKTAIHTIFNDTSYQLKVKNLSTIFRDNPIKPLDKAVYYVEHLLRTGGATHLKTAATKLSFLQLHLIDQIALITLMILIAIFALSKAMKWMRSKFQKRSKLHNTIKGSKKNKFKSN